MSAQRKPSSSVVKISSSTHAMLQDISRSEQRPMGEIVNELVMRYEEEQFWTRIREQLARLKADPVAWQDYMDELREWDEMAGDGLEDEDPYYTPEEEREILANAQRNQGG